MRYFEHEGFETRRHPFFRDRDRSIVTPPTEAELEAYRVEREKKLLEISNFFLGMSDKVVEITSSGKDTLHGIELPLFVINEVSLIQDAVVETEGFKAIKAICESKGYLCGFAYKNITSVGWGKHVEFHIARPFTAEDDALKPVNKFLKDARQILENEKEHHGWMFGHVGRFWINLPEDIAPPFDIRFTTQALATTEGWALFVERVQKLYGPCTIEVIRFLGQHRINISKKAPDQI